MVVFQLVDTASVEETIILKCGLEKYSHVCVVDVTGLKRIHVCNVYIVVPLGGEEGVGEIFDMLRNAREYIYMYIYSQLI